MGKKKKPKLPPLTTEQADALQDAGYVPDKAFTMMWRMFELHTEGMVDHLAGVLAPSMPARAVTAWGSSDRRRRLPPDWEKRRAVTRERAAGLCEGLSFAGEPAWHAAGCDGVGTQCDHHERGDDHSLANLRWLSGACHTAKTTREAAAARRSSLAAGRRPPERHPLDD